MSAAEKNFPDEIQAQNGEAKPSEAVSKADGVKDRPTLIAPPPRPVRPTPPKAPKPTTAPAIRPSVDAAPAAPNPTASATIENGVKSPPAEAEDTTLAHRYLPIAPPSEPMQYRAIGLVRGTYAPAEADQLNRGNLTTEDGQVIDAVLLGRITSLVKKHIDLTASHLWVVYPRTRREIDTEDDQDLHLQIVGVWEPETLGLPGESPASVASAGDSEKPEAADSKEPETADSEQPEATDLEKSEATAEPAMPRTIVLPDELPEVDDNFFSIRGEVVKYSPEDQVIMVKILQGVKRSPGQSKSFKLMLQGTIEGRTVGYFWDFTVKRDAKVLVMQEGSVVGIVPPKKRPKGGSRRGPAGRRPMGNRASMPSRRPIGAPERRPTGTQGSPRPRKPIVGKEQTEG